MLPSSPLTMDPGIPPASPLPGAALVGTPVAEAERPGAGAEFLVIYTPEIMSPVGLQSVRGGSLVALFKESGKPFSSARTIRIQPGVNFGMDAETWERVVQGSTAVKEALAHGALTTMLLPTEPHPTIEGARRVKIAACDTPTALRVVTLERDEHSLKDWSTKDPRPAVRATASRSLAQIQAQKAAP